MKANLVGVLCIILGFLVIIKGGNAVIRRPSQVPGKLGEPVGPVARMLAHLLGERAFKALLVSVGVFFVLFGAWLIIV